MAAYSHYYNQFHIPLVEESLRFTTPTVVKVFANMAEAREEIQKIVVSLTQNGKIFEVNEHGEVTWFGLTTDPEKVTVRVKIAQFRLVPLGVALNGLGFRVDADPIEKIEKYI